LNNHRTANCTVKKVINCVLCNTSKTTKVVSKVTQGNTKINPTINSRSITSGSWIIFEIYTDKKNVKWVACHGDNVPRYGGTKKGLIMSAGGRIDPGSNAYETAIKESYEEHGCNKNIPCQYITSSNGYHYFIRNVIPQNYDWKSVTEQSTAWEIIKDKNYIPNKCCSTSIQANNTAIWFLQLEALKKSKDGNIYYMPFLDAVRRYQSYF